MTISLNPVTVQAISLAGSGKFMLSQAFSCVSGEPAARINRIHLWRGDENKRFSDPQLTRGVTVKIPTALIK